MHSEASIILKVYTFCIYILPLLPADYNISPHEKLEPSKVEKNRTLLFTSSRSGVCFSYDQESRRQKYFSSPSLMTVKRTFLMQKFILTWLKISRKF